MSSPDKRSEPFQVEHFGLKSKHFIHHTKVNKKTGEVFLFNTFYPWYWTYVPPLCPSLHHLTVSLKLSGVILCEVCDSMKS